MLQPVLDGQVVNTREVFDIVGDERRFRGDGMRGNEDVEIADRRTLGSKVGRKYTEMTGANFIERQNCHIRDKCVDRLVKLG